MAKRTFGASGAAKAGYLAVGLALAFLASVSVGTYYTILPYGRGGHVLPDPLSLLSPLLYYRSGGARLPVPAQALYWSVSFVVVWLTLAACAALACRAIGARIGCWGIASLSLPYLVYAPLLAWATLALAQQGLSSNPLKNIFFQLGRHQPAIRDHSFTAPYVVVAVLLSGMQLAGLRRLCKLTWRAAAAAGILTVACAAVITFAAAEMVPLARLLLVWRVH